MPTETESPPVKTDAPVTPFAAKLEEAFKTHELPGAEKSEEAPKKAVVEKAKESPAPKVEETKTATPRELFKKPDAAAKEPEQPKSAIDEIAAPEFKDAKGKAGWEALKKEAKTHESAAKSHEARAKEFEAKLSEYEPLKTTLAERDKQIAEMSEVVARARMEELPDFKREFIDGRVKIVDRAKSIIEESGGDSKAVETALNLKGKPRADALREVAGDLDSFQAARLGRAIDELNDLDERATAKREKAKESYAEMQEQARQREVAERAGKFKNRLTEFDDTTRRLRTSLEVLNKAEGHDAWNARADAIVKEARDFIEAHPDADIEAELLSRSLPVYRDLFMQADAQVVEKDKKIAELEKELKAIHGKSPSLAARGSGAADKDADGKRPFMAALKQTVGEE